MEDPRPEKVAVVDEVRAKFDGSNAAVLTEYRGLDVPALAELRRAIVAAGGEYKIYKNTLVRFAARDLGLEIDDLLTGPTAIAFVRIGEDGVAGDAAAVAKALRDFSKSNDKLVLKGGVLDDKLLTVGELTALAELPSREVLLAQLAGAFQAPMAKLAGLLQAMPRDFAYGLKALIDQGGAPGAPAPTEEADQPEATVEEATDESEAPADAEATTDEPAAEAADETPADAADDAEAQAEASEDQES